MCDSGLLSDWGVATMKRFLAAATICLTASNALSAPAYSRAVQQLYEAGFVSCATAMDYVVKSIYPDDGGYAHFGQWSVSHTDSSIATTILSAKDVSGNVVTLISGVRNAAGSCDVTSTETINSPD